MVFNVKRSPSDVADGHVRTFVGKVSREFAKGEGMQGSLHDSSGFCNGMVIAFSGLVLVGRRRDARGGAGAGRRPRHRPLRLVPVGRVAPPTLAN